MYEVALVEQGLAIPAVLLSLGMGAVLGVGWWLLNAASSASLLQCVSLRLPLVFVGCGFINFLVSAIVGVLLSPSIRASCGFSPVSSWCFFPSVEISTVPAQSLG